MPTTNLTAWQAGAAIVAIALASLAACAAEGDLLDSGIRPEDVRKRSWLDYVRQCSDALMVHGTDRYGKTRGPLLMNILDVRTGECPANPKAFDEAWRVGRRGRRGPGGGNLYLDQTTLSVMRGLTGLTGSKKYADFAHKCANYTMTKLVDRNGLFWWGYHRHYDAHRDIKTGHSGNVHEIHVQQIAWPMLWAINPRAVHNEIEAIWQWHVIDRKTGEINRHADKKRGCDFAMSAGEILLAFAFLHARAKTRDTVWLDRARLVADYHWTRRRRTTNLIPNRPNAGRNRFDGSHFDTSITGLYCVRLLEAFELTGQAAFRDQAVAYLKAYAKYGWDAKAKTFWGCLKLDGARVPGPRIAGKGYGVYEPRGAIDLWQPYIAGYEHPLATAQAFAFAAEVTGDRVLLDAAGKWARCIRRRFPPRRCLSKTWYDGYARNYAPHGTYAGNYGRAISFFLHMARLTGDAAHRQFAEVIAREAVSKLYYRGLFRGHPAKPYYESDDDVGFLLRALVHLHQTSTAGDLSKIVYKNW